jgi:hypothetical protein
MMLLEDDYKQYPKHVGVVVYEQMQFVGNKLKGVCLLSGTN